MATKKLEELGERVFSIMESQIKGTTQCQEHYWIPIGKNQAECRNCPTAIRYDNKHKISKGKLVKR